MSKVRVLNTQCSSVHGNISAFVNKNLTIEQLELPSSKHALFVAPYAVCRSAWHLVVLSPLECI